MADINYTEYNSDNQYLRDIAGLSMSNNYTDYKSDNEVLMNTIFIDDSSMNN